MGVTRVMTTTRNQQRVAAAARKVGGYGELVRLAKERAAAGPSPKLTVDNGRYGYERGSPEA